jgi:hypothetical protein
MHTKPSTIQPMTASCPAIESPDTQAEPSVNHATRSAGDSEDSVVELTTTRLDALDHADALSTYTDSDTPLACRQATAGTLATVFDLTARLLARNDHTRQVVALALSNFEVRVLEVAHRYTAASHDNVDVESIYRDHAQTIQARRRDATLEVNVNAIGGV